MGKSSFVCLYMILSWSSFAQLNDTTIIAKSVNVKLSNSPTTPISNTTITFLKFKEDYGVYFSFLIPSKYISQIYIERVDSFVVGLSSNRRLALNRSYRDSIYYQLDGNLVWEIIYFIGKSEFEELKQSKIAEMLVTCRGKPLVLRLKRKSQTKVLYVASSF